MGEAERLRVGEAERVGEGEVLMVRESVRVIEALPEPLRAPEALAGCVAPAEPVACEAVSVMEAEAEGEAQEADAEAEKEALRVSLGEPLGECEEDVVTDAVGVSKSGVLVMSRSVMVAEAEGVEHLSRNWRMTSWLL